MTRYETRYAKNDTVYIIHNNKPRKYNIVGIIIKDVGNEDLVVEYALNEDNESTAICYYTDKDMYKSKEELIEYIQNL